MSQDYLKLRESSKLFKLRVRFIKEVVINVNIKDSSIYDRNVKTRFFNTFAT